MNLATQSGTGEQTDQGGYISINYKMNEQCQIFGGIGAAQIQDVEETASALQLVSNTLARIGYSQAIEEKLTFFSEIHQFQSGYLDAAGESDTTTISATMLEVGLIARF